MSKEKKNENSNIRYSRELSTKLIVNKSKYKIKNDSIGLTDVNYIQYIKLRELWVKLQK